MKHNVKGCLDCPFKYEHYNHFSSGKDTTVVCVLAENIKQPEHIISIFDAENPEKIKTPSWCPLKRDNVSIKLK